MRSNIFRSLAAVAIIAAASAVAYTNDVIDRVRAYARAVIYSVVSVFKVDSPSQPVRAPEAEQSMGLVEAKAFLMRLAKRDRPRHDPMWRMCPTT